jgi:DNA-binding NarL/FixJ family response regulator
VKILIIDDEKLDLFIAGKLLNMEYEAVGFTDPEEAYRWAADNAFDVAVIDYYLTPPVLADHALDRLKALGKPFRAFVLTNFVDYSVEQALLSKGFVGVLTKPLTLEKFKQAVSAN